ncbi:MAG: transcription antitermination factor NusB [Lachnospiraceae bacterium]
MTRREIREQIFCMLFCTDFYAIEEVPQQIRNELDAFEVQNEKDKIYMQEKLDAIVDNISDLDQSINTVAKGWKTTRMSKVDLTLLRLAVYEMKYEDTIPSGVAINEAVELAKKYGTDDSSSFVNAILAKLA